MNILVYFGHPAQYLFLRETIRKLSAENNITILIKTKDVLEELLKSDGLKFINILPKERSGGKISILFSLIKRNFKLIPIIIRTKPHLMIGTDASIAQMGFLFKINRITITEDDYPIIKHLARLSYPFTSTILCPSVCEVGRWSDKKIGYNGYMKLAYLHPKYFKPNKEVITKYNLAEKYVLIRLAKLTAHHDFGITGLRKETLDKVIHIIRNKGYKVYISSEGKLDESYHSHELKIDPSDIHHILNYSSLLVCDSQSMSVEASMLGTPSIRVSDFAGKISVLEELESKYELTFGVKPNNEPEILSALNTILSLDDPEREFRSRRDKMLSEKINVTEFLFWFIKNYPKSRYLMKKDPDLQYKFN